MYQEPAAGAKAAVGIDAFGNLMTRGPVLTDEDSYFDDFVTSTLDPSWTEEIIGSASHTITNSILNMTTDGQAGSSIKILREGDYGPMTFGTTARVENSQANSIVYLGFSNEEVPGVTTREAAVVTFDTEDLRIAKFQTFASLTQIETTDFVLPGGTKTNEWNRYTVEVGAGYSALRVNDVQVARHKTHIPGPYGVMYYGALISNRVAVGRSVCLCMDNAMFRNHNAVEIAGHFTGEPLRVAFNEMPEVQIWGQHKVLDVEHEGLEGAFGSTGRELAAVADMGARGLLGEILCELRKLNTLFQMLSDEELRNEDIDE